MDNLSDWIRADLAREAHLDPAVISNLITGKRGPGPETLKAIAKAFNFPPETLFRAAGWLSEISERRIREEKIAYRLGQYSDSTVELVLDIADKRDSGGRDQDLSTLQQQASIEAWCRQHGFMLTRLFIDAARSGTRTAGREQFLEMAAYFASQPPEAGLVIWEYAAYRVTSTT